MTGVKTDVIQSLNFVLRILARRRERGAGHLHRIATLDILTIASSAVAPLPTSDKSEARPCIVERMKWISAVQSILIGSVAVQGFTSPAKPSVRPSSQLQAQNENKHFSFGTAVAAAVAGWSLATQVVFAGALPQNNGTSTPIIGQAT